MSGAHLITCYMYMKMVDWYKPESRLVIPQNNFDQTFTFNRSSFHHSVQEINEIWYPRMIITLPGHQVSLTSYKKWWNGE